MAQYRQGSVSERFGPQRVDLCHAETKNRKKSDETRVCSHIFPVAGDSYGGIGTGDGRLGTLRMYARVGFTVCSQHVMEVVQTEQRTAPANDSCWTMLAPLD